MKRIYAILLVIVMVGAGCRQRYEPKVNSLDKLFLVIEANLNPGPDSTVIRLTRTSKLSDRGTSIKGERGALVIVEGKDNTTRNLIDKGNGYYFSNNLNLTIGTGYRLRIKTADGKEYLSDYVTAQATPPIDSVGLDLTPDGAQVYASTHDPLNATRYYRWAYDETWEIHAYYYSSSKYVNGMILPRDLPAEDVYTCWKSDTSTSIILNNTTRLQQDIISKMPLVFIPNGDDKLQVRYSITLRQYALSKEAYNFYEIMKKNTEEIGSLFSPQPSEIAGNIRCTTDPTEYVLGYLTVSVISSKRAFFIVPTWTFRMGCDLILISKTPMLIHQWLDGGYMLIDTLGPIPTPLQLSTEDCVDCRVRGGNKNRPPYW